jgi:HD superfamily phosphohydrolase
MTGIQKDIKEIRDAVHGDIGFDKFEQNIINTKEFQRMRGIRQLGLGYLVYPSAHHCRFEHSLGVAHMAGKIIEACESKDISKEQKRFIRVLALIHDIGHIPFGHTLEDERPIYPKNLHHDGSERLSLFLTNTELEKAKSTLGKDIGKPELPKDLIKLMKHTHEREEEKEELSREEELYAKIVGNTICADLLDYLKRDPYFTGIHHSYDEKIISAFEIRDSKILLDLQDGNQVRHGVLSEILHLLRLRYTLGERVYYHTTKASASAMISKAVELSELPHEALARLRDDELLYILENATSGSKIFKWPIKKPKQVSHIVKNIRCRHLYEPVYIITREVAHHYISKLVSMFHNPENHNQRADVEKKIAKYAGLRTDQVIIYCPDEEMSTKAAMVNVLWPKENEPMPLEELCKKKQGIEDENTNKEIEQLKGKHEALWRLSVFVDPSCSKQFKDIVAFCETTEEFYHIKNQNKNYVLPSKERLFEHSLYRAIENTPTDKNSIIYPETVQELAKSAFHKSSEVLGIKEVQDQIVEKPTKETRKKVQKDFNFDKNDSPEDTISSDNPTKE